MASKGGALGALFCDTNVLIRLLTDDPPDRAQAAESALDAAAANELPIILTDLIIAEVAYVLTSVYELSIDQAAERLGAVLDLRAVSVADEPLLRDALGVWRQGGLDFADAYLAALARSTRRTGVLSFDPDFDQVSGLERYDPAILSGVLDRPAGG